MPRPTYGPEVKRRTQQLLMVLVDYGNDELEPTSEAELDRLRSQIQLHWQSDTRLVVRTKVRFLETLTRLAQQPLSADHIKEGLRRLTDFLEILEDNRPNASGSETWHFTLNLWHSRRDRAALLTRFDREWEQRRPLKSKSVEAIAPNPIAPEIPSSEVTESDRWWEACQHCLTAQNTHRLTTNPLTARDGLTFEREALYVPLTLVARSRDEDEDEPTTWTPDTLLNEMLPMSDLRRVAIVGEAGTGKTTLLQHWAVELLDRRQLPIWVSLADLQGQTLEQYLLNDWLRLAMRQIVVSADQQQAFGEQVQQGRVWLLLDGIDEMALEASAALSTIARQLRGWLVDAHVIITCRLHVWDSGKNGLDMFDAYENLPLQWFDNQQIAHMGQIIRQWFADRPELSDRLQAELAKSAHNQLRQTVKNPLRLALLCRAWSLNQGQFPSSKAMLYQQFVDALYEWKQDALPTSFRQRQQLNNALGTLAIAALRQPNAKFRLAHSFVAQTWGTDWVDWLPIALQTGWLTPVGIAPDSGEKIYAFSHPTFQEYFAAQAICIWQDLFTDEDWIPQLLAPQWREVILFWFGSPHVNESDKEELIQKLIEWDDRCGGFYSYQAYFLAAAAIAEFPSIHSRSIVEQIAQWRFNVDQTIPSPVIEASRIALLHTDRPCAIATLTDLAQSNASLFIRWHAAYSLGRAFDPGNPIARDVIATLLQESTYEPFQIKFSDSLAKIDPTHELPIQTLTHIIHTTQKPALRRKAAYCLGKICPHSELAIATLVACIETGDRALQSTALQNLSQIAPNHPLAQISPEKSPSSKPRLPRSLDQEITALENKLTNATHPIQQFQIATRLGALVPGHEGAIATLIHLLQTSAKGVSSDRTAARLCASLTPESMGSVVRAFRTEKSDRSASVFLSNAHYSVLWHCAKRLPYSIFYEAWR